MFLETHHRIVCLVLSEHTAYSRHSVSLGKTQCVRSEDKGVSFGHAAHLNRFMEAESQYVQYSLST